MFDSYNVLKMLHILGVILLVGNVTITASWKVYADFSRDPRIIAHAQRSVAWADWLWTLMGITLVSVGGYGAALVQGIPLFSDFWMLAGQGLFLLSGLIWLGLIVPIQVKQGRAAREFALSGTIPPEYWRLSNWWMVWGVAATIPLLAAIWVMVAKPAW